MMNNRGLPLTRIGKVAPLTNAYYSSNVLKIPIPIKTEMGRKD
jgi:hypothetical protein